MVCILEEMVREPGVYVSGARNGEAQMALLCNEAHEFNCKKTLIKFK